MLFSKSQKKLVTEINAIFNYNPSNARTLLSSEVYELINSLMFIGGGAGVVVGTIEPQQPMYT